MELKVEKYKGSYATTSIDPTEKEILFVLNNISSLIATERIKKLLYSSDDISFCECEEGSNVYLLKLNEDETDVPSDSWDEGDYRKLEILQCPNCESWTLID